MNINPQETALYVEKKGVASPEVLLVECDSTNTYAKGKSVAKDTIYISLEQSAGRGRDGREFLSNPGGIYMTIALLRSVSYQVATNYPIICGLAVRNSLLKCGLKADLKWPNDVKVNGKKLCGILAENDIQNGTLLLGIGLNVVNDLGKYDDIATSLKKLGISVNANELIADIYMQILSLERESFHDVLSAYRTACISIGAFLPDYGKVVGIDDNGFLKILDGSGKLITLFNPVE